jgi:fibro-slime domain-containing protein
VAGVLVLAAGALASCGSRTGLLVSDPCGDEGARRSCRDACGEGFQVCTDGFFGPCEVAVKTEACSNACGQGTRDCSDGEWSECDVVPVEEPCSNVCGPGTLVCENGRRGECQVPPFEQACTNLCGTGVQRCENGRLGACEVGLVQKECMSVCGLGHESCIDGAWQRCDAPLPKPPELQAVIRDFLIEHPDFELQTFGPAQQELGIVDSVLGPDDKPVYAGDPLNGTPTTTGTANFNQWYNDVPGVNITAVLPLALAPSPNNPALFVYQNNAFFPIDGLYFGNEGNSHNYHFTLEAKTKFQYTGGEVFRFTGDDDMWVFINRRLAIDLGGLHRPRSSSVEIDQIAGTHGLVLGQEYPLHFFFAERHTFESNFTIETSIAEPGSCD